MKLAQLLVLMALFALAACTPGMGAAGSGLDPAPTVSPAAQNDLANSAWTLVSFEAPAAQATRVAGSSVTVEFRESGEVVGSGGCNGFGGTYRVEDGTISFGEITRTLIACDDERIMQQELHYIQALESAGAFELAPDRLVIHYGDGSSALIFRPAAAATPAPAGQGPAETPPASQESPPEDAPASATASPPEEATRISFAPGETGAQVEAAIAGRGLDRYVLRALAGQVMTVEITSPNDDVLLAVVGADGIPLKRAEAGLPSWSGPLPATQDYFIHAVSAGPATSYVLHVAVQSLPAESAERVSFASGTTSAQLSGLLPSGESRKEYVLWASEGQVLQVQVTSPDVPVSFTIESPGGTIWPAQHFDSEVYLFSQRVILQESGDYLVALSKAERTPSTTYDVMYTITSPEAAWVREQFGEAWNIAYPEGWAVDAAGAHEGVIRLQGQYGAHSYQVTLSYPIGITAPSLDTWVEQELAALGADERANVVIVDVTVASAPARKVLNLPSSGQASPAHHVYLWRTGATNPRLITITQLDDQAFDLTAMELLLDRFIAGVQR